MAGRKLGRGLQFLLSNQGVPKPAERAVEELDGVELEASRSGGSSQNTATSDQLHRIPIGDLVANPNQPRQEFDEKALDQLAASIRKSGVLQPILVRRTATGYELIAGERRLRAARMAGLTEIPALVRSVDEQQQSLLALVENLQREDLDPIEKAEAFRAIRERTNWTHDQLATELGFERSSISNMLRLLELPAPVQTLVRTRRLTMGHARALLAAPSERRRELADLVLDQGLSVRATEKLASESRKEPGEPKSTPKPSSKAAWAVEMETHLRSALGCPTNVSFRRGKGRIVLELGSREEFDRVYELLMTTVPGSNEEELIAQRRSENN